MTSDTVKYNGTQVLSASYTYDDKDNITNKLYTYNISGEESTVGFINQYDDKDRITAKGYDSYDVYYTYDSNGQLARVDDGYTNSSTTVYSYDSRGNITAKNVYPFTRNETITSSPTETKTFTYANFGWKDLLIAVDDAELTYDEIGNVLSFGNRSFTWNSGRNLASITDGNNTYSYKYDENGIRTSKTVNGFTTYYNTKNGVILSQSDGTNTMYFRYDTSGTPLGFILNGTQYFYMTNQMGDVIFITEANGNIFCEYVYDEWGKVIAINYVDENNAQQIAVATANPLRYRGYYYDSETGYYYLQSRYYDPSICRFINADIPEIAGISKDVIAGTNLFAYCNNEPVNNSDPMGTHPFLAIGFQFMIAIGACIIGFEFLWDTNRWRFYTFMFIGGNRSFLNSKRSTLDQKLRNAFASIKYGVRKLNLNSIKKLKNFGISASLIAVLGNKKARFPSNYCGWFSSVSLTYKNISVSGAWSKGNGITIGSVTLGLSISTSPMKMGISQTYYIQLSGNNAMKNNLSALKSAALDKLSWLKLFCLFVK